MGCDYYIVKFLKIYYNKIDYLVVELDRERGYYNFQYDEDYDDYRPILHYIDYTHHQGLNYHQKLFQTCDFFFVFEGLKVFHSLLGRMVQPENLNLKS